MASLGAKRFHGKPPLIDLGVHRRSGGGRALAAAKTRGVKLGGNRGAIISDEAREVSREARHAASEARAADLAPVIAELQAAGVTSLGGLATGLTERGIPTARGRAKWTPVQVSRVLAKLHI